MFKCRVNILSDFPGVLFILNETEVQTDRINQIGR
jgi:hypothetical protein